jgi:hypothetical protein
MIELSTRALLRSGDSHGVALSPDWLRSHHVKRLHLIYLDGMIVVFTADQAQQVAQLFQGRLAEAIRTLTTPQEAPRHDTQPTTPPGD